MTSPGCPGWSKSAGLLERRRGYYVGKIVLLAALAAAAFASLISLIEEACGSTDTIGLVQLAAAGIQLIATQIHTGSAAAGRTLAEFRVPDGTMVAAVIHAGQPTVPTPGYQCQSGDTILIVTNTATESDIQSIFQ